MAPAPLNLNSTSVMACASVKETLIDRPQLQEKTRNARVLVLGGTGRVGGSTAVALSKLSPQLQIVVGCRNRCGSFSPCCRAFSTVRELQCTGSCYREQGEERWHIWTFVMIPAMHCVRNP